MPGQKPLNYLRGVCLPIWGRAVNSFGSKPSVLLHDLAGMTCYSHLLALPGFVDEFVQSCIDILDRHVNAEVSLQRNRLGQLGRRMGAKPRFGAQFEERLASKGSRISRNFT